MKVTPRHNKFINAIADSPIHVIATMRGKDAYETVKDDKTGKMSVQKLGVGAKQRDGFEYEFTCTFLIDQKTSCAEAQKDNTHIFENEGATLLTELHGKKIIQWANSGEGYTAPKREAEPTVNEDELKEIKTQIIDKCKKLGGSQNESLMAELKKFVPTGNPNGLKTVDDAKACLDAISNL